MNKNRKQSRRNSQLDKKLAAYSLAGAAALIAPAVAKANIVYVGNVDQTVSDPNSYDFNLSGLSSDDITITAQNYGEIDASTANGAQVLMDTVNSDVAALAFGALIDPTSATNWGTGGKMASSFSADPGDWSSTGGSSYLGFYFESGGEPYAGWADIATTTNGSTSSFEILSYAYETTANTPITAGEGSPVPEPHAMPLLALGGAGLIALRRRRAANA